MQIGFDKIDGFIKIYNGTIYLILLGPEKYDASYDRISYLISLESWIIYIFVPCFAKIKVDSYDSLVIEKILAIIQIVITRIKPVLNKDKKFVVLEDIFSKMLISIC